jgi:hypothetical protein
MNEVIVRQATCPEAGEAHMLARELATAYEDRVRRFKHEQGLPTEEALTEANKPASLSAMFRIMDRPPEEVIWEDLQALVGNTGERSVDRWEEVKQAAQGELRSGDRAGMVLLGRDCRPIDLARFLAVRDELAEGWQPRNGVERQLVEQMAQARAAMNVWLRQLSLHDAFADPDGAEKVGAMVDRFHRMFMRTLRALHDLRKLPPTVFVQNAGQLNVGGQQVNLAPQAGGRNGATQPGRQRRRRCGRPGACTCPADRATLMGECE